MGRNKISDSGWDELDDVDDLLQGREAAPRDKKDFGSFSVFDRVSNYTPEISNRCEELILPEEPLADNKNRRRSMLDSVESNQTKKLGYSARSERLGEQSSESDSNKDEFNRLFAKGVYLLGMREHSVHELTNKLNAKTEFGDVVLAVIDELLENDYVSDMRFAESYVRSRTNRGFGPVKICAELNVKGVKSSLIRESVDSGSSHWFDVAREQYEKKYRLPAADYKEWTKRARFLQGRGFSMEHIQAVRPSSDFY